MTSTRCAALIHEAVVAAGLAKLVALELDLVLEQLVLRADGDVLADGHAEAARQQTRDAREDDGMPSQVPHGLVARTALVMALYLLPSVPDPDR
jgi:hypothetical protein